jgi:hypothetical protein
MANKVQASSENERAALAMQMLAAGEKKGAVKRALRERFGLDAWRAEPVITAASGRLADAADLTRIDRLLESAAFYREVLRDPKASGRDRLEALLRLHGLLGLGPPTLTQQAALPGEAGGSELQVQTSRARAGARGAENATASEQAGATT